jgi:hypothetical protein
MKKFGVLLGVVALLNLVYAAGAFAADRDLPWHLMKGSTFMGADVENPQGQNLGDIKDVVMDRASGRIAYAVVSFGAFWGWEKSCLRFHGAPFLKPATTRISSCLPSTKNGSQTRLGLTRITGPRWQARNG